MIKNSQKQIKDSKEVSRLIVKYNEIVLHAAKKYLVLLKDFKQKLKASQFKVAEIYPDYTAISQTLSDQLPWSHHVTLLKSTNSSAEKQ